MPRTGGGGMAMMNASWIACSRPNELADDRARASALSRMRSSNGSKRREDRRPAFEALVKVAPEKPGEGDGVGDAGRLLHDLGGAPA